MGVVWWCVYVMLLQVVESGCAAVAEALNRFEQDGVTGVECVSKNTITFVACMHGYAITTICV